MEKYSDPTNTTFTKCIVICGAPGSGKSYLMNYIAPHIISLGYNVGATAMIAHWAVHLGRIQIHKLFGLKVSIFMTLHQMADTSCNKLLGDHVP